MGQIVSAAAKPKRCNLQSLSSLGTPAAGEYILVSSDNSMNAAGQGNFDCYIVGTGRALATALPLMKIVNVDAVPTEGSDNPVSSNGVYEVTKDIPSMLTAFTEKTNALADIDVEHAKRSNYSSDFVVTFTNGVLSIRGVNINWSIAFPFVTVIGHTYKVSLTTSVALPPSGTRYVKIFHTVWSGVLTELTTSDNYHFEGEFTATTEQTYLAFGINSAQGNMDVTDILCIDDDGEIELKTTDAVEETNELPITSKGVYGALQRFSTDDDELLFSREAAAVDTAINVTHNINTQPVGTIFRIHVDTLSDSTGTSINLRGTGVQSDLASYENIEAGKDYYYIKRSTYTSGIRIYKGAATGNVFDYKIYKTTKLPVGAIEDEVYTEAEKQDVTFYAPVNAYPSSVVGNFVASSYFSSTEWQFNRGMIFDVAYDTTLYQLVLLIKLNNGNGYLPVNNVATGSKIDTSSMPAWCLQLKKKDYAAIPADTICTAVTISNVTGTKFEKGLAPSTFYTNYNSLVEKASAYGSINVGEKLIIHHINVESTTPHIPSQSVLDVAYASKLGAAFIEANTHKCSDGVYVVKHGNSGKLGAGLSFVSGSSLNANSLFSAVTSTQLRSDVTYNCTPAKNNVHIPTLDEFCAECSRQGVGVLLQIVDGGELPIARKYLPDSKIMAYGLTTRGDFRGTIMLYRTDATPSDMLTQCNKYGAPFAYSWSGATSKTDEEIIAAAEALHKAGYILGTAYASPTDWDRLKSLGVDFLAATGKDANVFNDGTLFNIVSMDDENISLGSGITYDATTGLCTMSSGSEASISKTEYAARYIKVCVRVRYEGTLTITIGNSALASTLGIYQQVSDGSREVAFAVVSELNQNLIKMHADAATTISEFNVVASVVY